jgi:hypothetical protein
VVRRGHESYKVEGIARAWVKCMTTPEQLCSPFERGNVFRIWSKGHVWQEGRLFWKMVKSETKMKVPHDKTWHDGKTDEQLGADELDVTVSDCGLESNR